MPGVQPDIAQRLHIDLGQARRVAEGAERFAELLEQPSIDRASTLVLAASCWSLLSVNDATRNFSAAADEYGELGRWYAAPLRICAASPERPAPPPALADGDVPHELDANDVLAALLAAHWLFAVGLDDGSQARGFFGYLSENAALRVTSVGRLSIPLRHYLAYANSLDTAGVLTKLGSAEDGARTIGEGLIALLAHAEEPYQAVMADRFHWPRLRSGLLPVEPEMLAVSVLASATARRLNVSLPAQSVRQRASPVSEAMLLLGQIFVLEKWEGQTET